MPLLRKFGSHGALTRGYRAWLSGDIARAAACLERAVEQSPASPGVLLHLSRVLSEQGRAEEALARLEEAMALDSSNTVGPVFRAMVHYDHRGPDAAREALNPVGADNLLAEALRALLDLRRKLESPDPEGEEREAHIAVSMPPAARWISEVTGRILAPLEVRFRERYPEDFIAFHHGLFAPAVRSLEAGEELQAPPCPDSEKEWARRVEDAFCTRQYEATEELCRHGDKQEWARPAFEWFRIFSLLAQGKEKMALQVVSRLLEKDRRTTDLHFLQGLCHVCLGHLQEAGWSFSRAARAGDIEVDEVLQEVSRRVHVQWNLVDSPCQK